MDQPDPMPGILGLALLGLTMFIILRAICWKAGLAYTRHRCHACLYSWLRVDESGTCPHCGAIQ